MRSDSTARGGSRNFLSVTRLKHWRGLALALVVGVAGCGGGGDGGPSAPASADKQGCFDAAGYAPGADAVLVYDWSGPGFRFGELTERFQVLDASATFNGVSGLTERRNVTEGSQREQFGAASGGVRGQIVRYEKPNPDGVPTLHGNIAFAVGGGGSFLLTVTYAPPFVDDRATLAADSTASYRRTGVTTPATGPAQPFESELQVRYVGRETLMLGGASVQSCRFDVQEGSTRRQEWWYRGFVVQRVQTPDDPNTLEVFRLKSATLNGTNLLR